MLLKFVKYLCKFGFGVDDKIQIRQFGQQTFSSSITTPNLDGLVL